MRFDADRWNTDVYEYTHLSLLLYGDCVCTLGRYSEGCLVYSDDDIFYNAMQLILYVLILYSNWYPPFQ